MTNEMKIYFDQKFIALDQKFDAIDQKFVTLESKFDKMNTEIEHIKTDIGSMKTNMGSMKTRIHNFEKIQLRMEHNHGGMLAAIFDKLDQFEKHVQNKSIHIDPYMT